MRQGLAGIAGPFLRAAAAGEARADEMAREIAETLRAAMFALGTRTLADLRDTPRLLGRLPPKADEP
jgi:isopentenyl diphosphate isomerase/L-lactate dehydrogenase-like FMN-dependent dehydrogenase